MKIHWYPGHIAKAQRKILEFLKFTDIILYVLDARIPQASRIIDFERQFSDKKIITILNKTDLIPKNIAENWRIILEEKFQYVIPFQANASKGTLLLKEAISKIKIEIIPQKILKDIKMLIIGIPNAGKSSLINRLAGKKSARVGKLAGVTRSHQWINFSPGLYILDQPGIFFPKFRDEEHAWRLAVTGAMNLEVLPAEEIAIKLICFLMKNGYLEKNDPHKYLEDTGAKLGYLENKKIDLNKTSIHIIKKFQAGKFGLICLENPCQF